MPDAKSENSTNELQNRWRTVLGMVEVQIDNQADFNAYLVDTTATSLHEGVLRITVRNGFVAAWIRQRVMPSIRRFATQVFGRDIKIEIDIASYVSSDVLMREGLAGGHSEWANFRWNRHRAAMARDNARIFPGDRSCTFERFEASESNRRALNAAKSVTESPGIAFNPLTIASETGQGKTHLLNAMANEMRAAQMNVICVSGEAFVDGFVRASKNGNVAALRDRYRDLDALLLDGVERLIGKEKTQSFFLELVEHLLSNRKQVATTFNTAYPMNELQDEITSRLAGGLEVRIERPDYELVRSVILSYAKERGLRPLASDALDYLREVTVRNVREIIGGISRVNADTKLGYVSEASSVASISRSTFEGAWRDRIIEPDPGLSSPDAVLDAVAEVVGIDPDALRRPGRGNVRVSTARDLAVYMLREKSGLTSTMTGELMGGRQHSTILAALNRYSDRRKREPQLIDTEHRVEQLLK